MHFCSALPPHPQPFSPTTRASTTRSRRGGEGSQNEGVRSHRTEKTRFLRAGGCIDFSQLAISRTHFSRFHQRTESPMANDTQLNIASLKPAVFRMSLRSGVWGLSEGAMSMRTSFGSALPLVRCAFLDFSLFVITPREPPWPCPSARREFIQHGYESIRIWARICPRHRGCSSVG